MFSSRLHYLVEMQRHDMERQQAHEYRLHRRLLVVNLQEDSDLFQSLRSWLAATLNWWQLRFKARETLPQLTERLRSMGTSVR